MLQPSGTTTRDGALLQDHVRGNQNLSSRLYCNVIAEPADNSSSEVVNDFFPWYDILHDPIGSTPLFAVPMQTSTPGQDMQGQMVTLQVGCMTSEQPNAPW